MMLRRKSPSFKTEESEEQRSYICDATAKLSQKIHAVLEYL